MAIDFEHCWEKLRDFFPEFNWSNPPSDKEDTEYVIRNNDKDRLRIKLGKTGNGISCKILILQGNKAESTRKMLSKIDIPNYFSFYHGGNAKKVCDICKNATDIKVINGKPIHIGFINLVDMTEELVPFGEDDTVKQALKTRIDKLTDFIQNFVKMHENKVYSKDTDNPPTRNRTKKNKPAETKSQSMHIPQTIIDNPKQGKPIDDIEKKLGIQSFPVSEYCEKIREFGKRPLEIKLGSNIYYFTRIKSSPQNLYEYHLCRLENNQKRVGEVIHIYDIAAWPMTKNALPFKGMPADMPFGPNSNIHNGDNVSICGIERPNFNPQIIILGMNPSETPSMLQDTSGTAWKNAYNALANIFLDSFLAGGYFTDVIKCYPKTYLKSEDSKRFLQIAKTNNGVPVTDGEKEYTWFELYLIVLKWELDQLRSIFNLQNKKFVFFVCGSKAYKKMPNFFINALNDLGDIYIMGRHYSTSPAFKQDKSKIVSCRRMYKDINKLYEDGRKKPNADRHNYKFILLEDEFGELHAYSGNDDN